MACKTCFIIRAGIAKALKHWWAVAVYTLASGESVEVNAENIVTKGPKALMGRWVYFEDGHLYRVEEGEVVADLGPIKKRVEKGAPTTSTRTLDAVERALVMRSLKRSR